MSGPAGYVSSHAATSFVVTVTALQGAPATTLKLETRTLGSADDWTTQASDASPAVGDTLTASGLTQDTSLEWRLIETSGATTYDGTHGIVTPAASIWSTLLATIATALEGQGMAAAAIYTGRWPESNYPAEAAVLRSVKETQRGGATTQSERWEFEAEVEIRIAITDDDGDAQKVSVETWQRRIEAALHEKHAGDFPGIQGLEAVRVEIDSKDDAPGGRDQYGADLTCSATVRFAIWRAR